MQSILVLIGGGERDEVIIRAAHAAAVPLGAHLEFLHVRVSAPVAMRHDEHAQFAMGAGMQNALQDFDTRASTFSQVASDHALGFVKLLEKRRTTEGTPITATYREVHDAPIERGRRSLQPRLGRDRPRPAKTRAGSEHARNADPSMRAAAADPRDPRDQQRHEYDNGVLEWI
jgi:hypothetical protein